MTESPSPRPSARPLVVFDLDGTLADTAADLIGVLNGLLAREGLSALPVEQAGSLIGAGARALISRGYAANGRELTPDRLDALFEEFLERYANEICTQSRLYPGVVEALDRLEAEGYSFAVCTNKPERHSRLLLDALGVTGRFAALCGRDTFAMFKPDPQHLLLTIERAGGDPARSVMVGDSLTDLATARAAGVRTIGVPFGYTDVPMRELGPDVMIERFDELHDAVTSLIGPR